MFALWKPVLSIISACAHTHSLLHAWTHTCTCINRRYIFCPQGTTQDNIVGYADTHSNLNHKVTRSDCQENIPTTPLLLCSDICSLVGVKPRQGCPSTLARLNASLPCPPRHRMQYGALSSNSWQQTWAWVTAGLARMHLHPGSFLYPENNLAGHLTRLASLLLSEFNLAETFF